MNENVTESFEISPIAHIRTGFSSKFGIPRQSGVVKELCGRIELEKQYSSRDYVRGLEGFSHIWVIWVFSENVGERVCPTVRPPKLGGNKRMGVFATRSPFRPNFLALSCLEIEKIQYEDGKGTVIYVKGADMLDGTPIVDIKPYLPFTDSIPNALRGFTADEECEKRTEKLSVSIPEIFKSNFPSEHLDELYGILSENPGPTYINNPERIFSFEFYGKRIRYYVENDCVTVTEISDFTP